MSESSLQSGVSASPETLCEAANVFIQESVGHIRRASATDKGLVWIVQRIPGGFRSGEQLYGFRVVPEIPMRPNGDSAGRQRKHTELCRLHLVHHSCQFSHDCWFAHGIDELKPITRSGRYKTRPCRTFSRSQKCPYGTRCHYIHDLSAEDLARQVFTLSEIISEEQQPLSHMILASDSDSPNEAATHAASPSQDSASINAESTKLRYTPEQSSNTANFPSLLSPTLSPAVSPGQASMNITFMDVNPAQNSLFPSAGASTSAKPLRELPMRSPWSFQKINPSKAGRRPSYPPNAANSAMQPLKSPTQSPIYQSASASPVQDQLRGFSPVSGNIPYNVQQAGASNTYGGGSRYNHGRASPSSPPSLYYPSAVHGTYFSPPHKSQGLISTSPSPFEYGAPTLGGHFVSKGYVGGSARSAMQQGYFVPGLSPEYAANGGDLDAASALDVYTESSLGSFSDKEDFGLGFHLPATAQVPPVPRRPSQEDAMQQMHAMFASQSLGSADDVAEAPTSDWSWGSFFGVGPTYRPGIWSPPTDSFSVTGAANVNVNGAVVDTKAVAHMQKGIW